MNIQKYIIYLFIASILGGCSVVKKIKQKRADKKASSEIEQLTDSTSIAVITSENVDSMVSLVVDSMLNDLFTENQEEADDQEGRAADSYGG